MKRILHRVENIVEPANFLIEKSPQIARDVELKRDVHSGAPATYLLVQLNTASSTVATVRNFSATCLLINMTPHRVLKAHLLVQVYSHIEKKQEKRNLLRWQQSLLV